jgi:hypothetical protein
MIPPVSIGRGISTFSSPHNDIHLSVSGGKIAQMDLIALFICYMSGRDPGIVRVECPFQDIEITSLYGMPSDNLRVLVSVESLSELSAGGG